MAQTIEEQVNTVERALGERMIEHALAVVRAWLNELGENNPFEQAFADLQTQYNAIFADWLVNDDQEKQDQQLNELTSDAYRLVDAVYVQIRLFRGLSPHMRGYNNDSAASIMHYFSRCLELTEADYTWLQNSVNSSTGGSYALVAVAALAKNLRECFSERAMMALIEGINGSNAVVAEQCLANVLMLFAHYDVRIDFFPNLQEALVEAVNNMGDDGKQFFETMCAIVRSVKHNWLESFAMGEAAFSDLPDELQSLLEVTGAKNDLDSFASWIPASENEYIAGIVQILPNTWVFEMITADNPDRQNILMSLYLAMGSMELAWDRIEMAEFWLVRKLRTGRGVAYNYMHYGHCLLLRGDRMLAFEQYRQARQMCQSSKEFFAMFRPDRRALVDRGVPVEYIYFIEDQLLKGDA